MVLYIKTLLRKACQVSLGLTDFNPPSKVQRNFYTHIIKAFCREYLKGVSQLYQNQTMRVLWLALMSSYKMEKLGNDTAQALRLILNTLQSHQMMILQNRVALDYILAQKAVPVQWQALWMCSTSTLN